MFGQHAPGQAYLGDGELVLPVPPPVTPPPTPPPVKSEEARALLYRANNDARIVYRMNQLAALQGNFNAFVELWENYRVVYDWTNYIQGQPDEDFMAIEDYYTDGLKDIDGNASASAVHLRHVRRPNR